MSKLTFSCWRYTICCSHDVYLTAVPVLFDFDPPPEVFFRSSFSELVPYFGHEVIQKTATTTTPTTTTTTTGFPRIRTTPRLCFFFFFNMCFSHSLLFFSFFFFSLNVVPSQSAFTLHERTNALICDKLSSTPMNNHDRH